MTVDEHGFRPTWQLKCIFAVIGLLNFMAALDATSLSVALPTISDDLHGTAIEAFWSGTSFLVTSAVFQPVFCLASDIFGRKSALLAALVAFTVGAVVAAVASNFTPLLVGRCIQGIGGGGIVALTEVLIADLIPLKERGKWMSVRSATWALGTVLGPVIGGSLAQGHWRWIFYLNLPFCGVGLVLVPLFLRLHWEPAPLRTRLAMIDYIGCVLFAGSLSAFLIPLTWGGVMYPWDSWHTLTPLIIGVVGLLAFIAYEHSSLPTNPFIPLAIFANPSASLNYLACFLHGVILWCLLYYLPLYYEGALGYSTVIAGVSLFPETFTVAPISVIVGFAIAKTARYRWALWSGWSITTLGMGILHLLSADSSIPQWIFLNLVPGVGLGMLFSSLILAVQASADPAFLSITVTMTPFFRTLGQAVGVAIGGVVFQNQIRKEFAQHPGLIQGMGMAAEEVARDASALVQYIRSIPREDPQRHELERVYADALAVVYAVLCGVAGLGLLSSLFVRGYPMNQAFRSSQAVKTGHRGDEDGGTGEGKA